MLKRDVQNSLKNNIVAVIRIKDTNFAKLVTEEVIKSGFKFIELTLSIDNCIDLLKELKEKYKDVYIGTGTVLTVKDCEESIKASSDFIVSPCTNEEVIKTCNEHDILCLPGVATPTEIYKCYSIGCDIVKVFPGDILGASFIKNVKAPMPFVEYMPSGGVNIKNICEWFENGAYAVSVGSALYSGIDQNNIHEIKTRAEEYLKEVNKFNKSEV